MEETASWVIVNMATGEALFETFNPDLVSKINTEKYRAVPILEYLHSINRKIREEHLANGWIKLIERERNYYDN